MCGFPFAPIQILTGDTRKACSSRYGWLHDAGRSFQRKSRIERRFESLPGVQRFANLWGTPRSFRTSEKNKPVPFREVRDSANLDSAHRDNNFPRTKLKPFPKGESRFCKPRFSAPKLQLRTNPIKSFAASRPFRRLRRHFSCCCRNIFSALRRCPCRDSVPCRELFHTFC